MEKKMNIWHNNGGKDFNIKFLIEGEGGNNDDKIKNLPLGKIGDVVREIIECEVDYVKF
jgi:hypothetical protein